MSRRRARAAKHGGGRRGFIIVPVLWILLVLATLTGVLSVYLARSATALAVNDDHLRSDALVSAGLELTAYNLSTGTKQTRPLTGTSTFQFDGAMISVSFSAESSRVDLNLAPKQLLTNLFRVVGADPRDAEQYANRVVGWRSPQADTLDSENALYRSAGVSYLPRGAPFASVEELWLVVGLPPVLIERAMPYVTVYSGRHEVSVLSAAPEVIASLPGITPAALEQFLKQRQALARDIKAVGDVLGEARGSATVDGSDAIRVWTTVMFKNGRRAANETVILLEAGDEPYHILAWRDEADVGSSRRPRGGLL
ncbi:MAG: type II secretion system protein GspK [Xanthobacteraceae bacterium]|nr:type II secretion system protein GspK [Xanthobacteraceae bacterium]